MKRRAQGFTDALAEGRARKSALVLGVLCLLWLPCWATRESFGEALPILQTFYTLVFISSGLFLLAGREVLKRAAGIWHGATIWTALLLFTMHGRHWLDRLHGSPLYTLADALVYLVPLVGGIVLLGLGSRNWHALALEEAQPA
jgi:PAT family beta-lactamase induction signal transducer AmpG